MGVVTKGIWKPLGSTSKRASQGVSCFSCLFLAPTYNTMVMVCSFAGFVLREGQVGAQSPEHLSQEPLKVCCLKSSLGRVRTMLERWAVTLLSPGCLCP